LVRGREVSTQKFNSERQIAIILTKAAAACPRGGTTCCSIVSRSAVPNYRPERPFAIEGSLAIMNTKGSFWPHNPMITWAGLSSGRIQPFPQPSSSAVSVAAFGAKASPGAWPAIVGFPTHSELSAPRAIRLI
jgi:hypothetical protein